MCQMTPSSVLLQKSSKTRTTPSPLLRGLRQAHGPGEIKVQMRYAYAVE